MVGSLGLSCRHKIFYLVLIALVSLVKNIFFLAAHYFNFFMCPRRSVTWAGSRAGPTVSECVSPSKTISISCGPYLSDNYFVIFTTESVPLSLSDLYCRCVREGKTCLWVSGSWCAWRGPSSGKQRLDMISPDYGMTCHALIKAWSGSRHLES